MREFYQLMQQAIEGNPPAWFTESAGLCGNYASYMYSKAPQGLSPDKYFDALGALNPSFYAAGLNEIFPFNQEPYPTYTVESNRGAHYQNPARLAWIREHAK